MFERCHDHRKPSHHPGVTDSEQAAIAVFAVDALSNNDAIFLFCDRLARRLSFYLSMPCKLYPMSLIDLSHMIADGTLTYPGLPGPVISDHLSWDASHDRYAQGVEFQIGRIEMVANTGTYVDTPAHRWRDGYDLSELPIESVANVPGIVIDAATQLIEPDLFAGVDITDYAVIFRTGWARHWDTDHYGAPEHPFITAAAGEALVNAEVKLVGIDSVNIDDTSPESGGHRPVHSALLAANIPIVEHLCNLEQLTNDPFYFFAVPPKIRGMASFPVRAFALLGS